MSSLPRSPLQPLSNGSAGNSSKSLGKSMSPAPPPPVHDVILETLTTQARASGDAEAVHSVVLDDDELAKKGRQVFTAATSPVASPRSPASKAGRKVLTRVCFCRSCSCNAYTCPSVDPARAMILQCFAHFGCLCVGVCVYAESS